MSKSVVKPLKVCFICWVLILGKISYSSAFISANLSLISGPTRPPCSSHASAATLEAHCPTSLRFEESVHKKISHLKAQTHCHCWQRSLEWTLLFQHAHSLYCSRLPLGCLGVEGRLGVAGSDAGAPESHQLILRRAKAKDPAEAWRVEGQIWMLLLEILYTFV